MFTPLPTTPEERRLSLLLKILSIVFGLAIFGYLLPALMGPNRHFFINLPFVTNSVVKIGTLALLAFIASGDVRRFRVLTLVVIAGHIISELAVAAVLIWGNTSYDVVLVNPLSGAPDVMPISSILVGSMVMDGVIIVFLVWFFIRADRAWMGLRYLSPMQYRTLTALADVVIAGKEELVPPEEVASNVDRYLHMFRARSKWIMKLVLTSINLYPLLSLKPPFTYMDAGTRLAFIRKRFYQQVTRRLVPPFWRMLAQGMIRMGKQLSYLGYYNDSRTFASVGYTPFSERKDTAQRFKDHPLKHQRQGLLVMQPSDVTVDTLNADVVIIGSGAGAAIMAYGLAKAGREVVMIERGQYVDPSQFTEDEMEMLAKLYSDGALQLSMDFRFQVLQGSCVGGTTVVNNAVCFDLPDDVLTRWNDSQTSNAGLDPKRVRESHIRVRQLLNVTEQNHKYLNKGAQVFLKGLKSLGLNKAPNMTGAVWANIADCLGCGYCNIGCSYGRKLSVLDTVLPQIQKEFGKGALRIIPECEAVGMKASGQRITAVTCRVGSERRRIDLRAKTVVVSAGAVSSSVLLLKSCVGGRNVGKNLSFNMGSPMTAVFPHEVNSFDGLQISHYLKISPNRGYIVETWFNPPVAQALTMPGWFEDHFTNMKRYNRISCTGVLVPTESNGQVRLAGLTGREVNYSPTRGDLDKLLDGLILSGEIFLAAGAECVIPNTFDYHEMHNLDELRGLKRLIKDPSDITLGTGHPQGGNVISRNPERGVINEEFRVFGYDNLFVADASVFPSSVGVNPQLTVMALADYAVPFVAYNSR